MAYMMEMALDNSRRFRRKRYLFEYQGVQFMLVQDNPRRHADHLLTLVPDSNSSARDRAFAAAAEFVSALAWETGARMMVREALEINIPNDFSIRDAKPAYRTFPRIPYGGPIVGYDLARVPSVTSETHRIALALFREANASNNDYLSFLFFWQVLTVEGRHGSEVVDDTFKTARSSIRLSKDTLDSVSLGQNQSLGEYLYEDCRNAIAHIKRHPGKRALDLDKRDERRRFAVSVEVIREFAAYYIREQFGPKDYSGYLYLARGKRGALPAFVDAETFRRAGHKLAYPQLKPKLMRRPVKRR